MTIMPTLSPNRSGQTFQLPGGRRLGYAEYGDPLGKPLFYFHGWPSSRIEFSGLEGDNIAAEMNLRVISIDRPGFGLSDFQPSRSFLNWPQDVCRLADALALDRFAVMSYSAGSPYAAACAYAIPDRLSAAGIVSGLGQPFNAPGATRGMPTILLWSTARVHPRLTWLLFKMMKNTLANAPRDKLPASAKQAMMAQIDFDYLRQNPRINGLNLEGGLEALRQGGYGPAYDASLYWKPWGFRLEDIRIRVFVWHGEDDLNAPCAAHGRLLADRIPNVEAKFYPGEGHLSLIHTHLRDILETFSAYH